MNLSIRCGEGLINEKCDGLARFPVAQEVAEKIASAQGTLKIIWVICIVEICRFLKNFKHQPEGSQHHFHLPRLYIVNSSNTTELILILYSCSFFRKQLEPDCFKCCLQSLVASISC
ncbi:unnamed protein product [Caenorhabditis nigoni]